jgi:hypothetical protein
MSGNPSSGPFVNPPDYFQLRGEKRAEEAKQKGAVGYDPLADMEPFQRPRSVLEAEFRKTSEAWFNAFWSECIRLYQNGRELKLGWNTMGEDFLLDIAKQAFVNEVAGTGGAIKYLKVATKWKNEVKEVTKKGILQALFDISYEVFPTSYRYDVSKLLQTTFEFRGKEDAPRTLYLAFRCDSRPKETIKAQGGAKCRADQTENLKALGFEEEWNPLKYKKLQQSIYYRKGSADNDLNTATSIAQNFEAAAGFPLIDDYRLRHPCSSDFFTLGDTKSKTVTYDTSKWNLAWAEMTRRIPANVQLGLCNATVAGQKETHFAMRSFVYIVKVTGEVYHTEQHQLRDESETFPEAAVRGLDWEDYLALVPVRRLHEGSRKADGYSVYPEQIDVLHDDSVLEALLGTQVAVRDFKTRLYNIVNSMDSFANATRVRVPAHDIEWPSAWGPYGPPLPPR